MATLKQYETVLGSEKTLEELTRGLGSADLIPLLVKYGGLERREGDELKTNLRGKLGRDRNTAVINRIVEKDTLASYQALSMVVQYKNEHVWKQVFPFADGTHRKLTVTAKSGPFSKPPQYPMNLAADSQPTIIWMCATDEIFSVAAKHWARSDSPLQTSACGKVKYYVLPFLNEDSKIWLCRPTTIIQDIDFSKLFTIYNQTKACLYTGLCKPPEPEFTGDICVAKSSGSYMNGFTASLELDTEQWRKSNDKDDQWFCSEKQDDCQVVFKKVGDSELDNTVEYVSKDGSLFLQSNEKLSSNGFKLQHTAILAALQDDSGRYNGWCQCKDESVYHVLQYSYRVIRSLVTRYSVTKCRTGRNPSV